MHTHPVLQRQVVRVCRLALPELQSFHSCRYTPFEQSRLRKYRLDLTFL